MRSSETGKPLSSKTDEKEIWHCKRIPEEEITWLSCYWDDVWFKEVPTVTLWHPSAKSWWSQSHNQTDGRRTDECGGFSRDGLHSGSNRKLVCLLDLPHGGHQEGQQRKSPRLLCPAVRTSHQGRLLVPRLHTCLLSILCRSGFVRFPLSRSHFKLALEFNSCLTVIKCQTFCCYRRTLFCPTYTSIEQKVSRLIKAHLEMLFHQRERPQRNVVQRRRKTQEMQFNYICKSRILTTFIVAITSTLACCACRMWHFCAEFPSSTDVQFSFVALDSSQVK